MKKTPIIATFCVLVMCVLVFQASPSVADTCTFDFEATVRVGPNTGKTVGGILTVEIDEHGSLSGSLISNSLLATEEDPIAVVGQVNGRAINLALQLQKSESETTAGQALLGTGTAAFPISSATQCGGAMGGTFAGPNAGDIGDWLVCIGIRVGDSFCAGISF
jgi:hypothetical protein